MSAAGSSPASAIRFVLGAILHCMKKSCSLCKKQKPLDDFHFKSRSRGSRHSWCKECHKKYRDRFYQEKRDIYIQNAMSRKRRVSVAYRIKILEYLKEHPCVDCGEADPIVLEFDHVRGHKQFSVGQRVASGGNWEKILAEIEKCEVRCCNCHRRKTAHELGWHRGLVA